MIDKSSGKGEKTISPNATRVYWLGLHKLDEALIALEYVIVASLKGKKKNEAIWLSKCWLRTSKEIDTAVRAGGRA